MSFLDSLMFWKREEDLGNPLYAVNLSYDRTEGVIPIGIEEVTGRYIFTDRCYLLRGNTEGLPVKEGKIDVSTFISPTEDNGKFNFFYDTGDVLHYLAGGKPDKLRALTCTPELKAYLREKEREFIGRVAENAEELARAEQDKILKRAGK